MKKETYEALERTLAEYIQALGNVPPDSDAAKRITDEVEKMFKMLNESDKIENDRIFKEASQEMEMDKEFSKKERFLIDMIKIFGPPLLTIIAYAILQKRLLKFEENGRLCTSAGRDFHLPKFWR